MIEKEDGMKCYCFNEHTRVSILQRLTFLSNDVSKTESQWNSFRTTQNYFTYFNCCNQNKCNVNVLFENMTEQQLRLKSLDWNPMILSQNPGKSPSIQCFIQVGVKQIMSETITFHYPLSIIGESNFTRPIALCTCYPFIIWL